LVTHAIKGAQTGDTLCFSWRPGTQQADFSAEGLFFLQRSIQAYARDGHQCDTWPVRPSEGPFFEWIELPEASAPLFSARSFRALTTEIEMVNTCRRTAEAEEAYREQNWDEDPVIGYLEIPKETEAHRALWSGSVCYLRVPVFMFEGAKEEF
jgi:hypothetical protein